MCLMLQAAPIPANDDFRVQALQSLNILDTPDDARFDLITEFAANEFNVPICKVSLIDKDRQWCKSVYGPAGKELLRDVAFCSYAIYEVTSTFPFERVYEICDATQDARFINNPLVAGGPHAKSYISFVLQSKTGLNLGTLCLIDTKPRKYSGEEIFSLVTIGGIVEDLINNVC